MTKDCYLHITQAELFNELLDQEIEKENDNNKLTSYKLLKIAVKQILKDGVGSIHFFTKQDNGVLIGN